MPTLPSGRRIEFSIDRVNAMVEMLPIGDAEEIVDALKCPDDLLWLLDLVGFSDQKPYWTNCLACDWRELATDWTDEDQESFADYLYSTEARNARMVAIQSLSRRIGARRATESDSGLLLKRAA